MRLLDLYCGPGGAGTGYRQAIPPAYTEYIGQKLMREIYAKAAAAR